MHNGNKQPYGNNDPFPALPWNNPHVVPILGLGDTDHKISPHPGTLDLTTVDNNAGVHVQGIGDVTPQGPNNDLAFLRSRFPFLPIMPFPNNVAGVFLPVALTPDEIQFPDGTTLVLFRGSNDYFVSLHGNAEVPSAANAPSAKSGGLRTVKSIYKPEGFFFYVGNVKTVSVVAPNANTFVTVLCYSTNNWPSPENCR